ncbi:MAG: hypothetical protein A2749_00845 [Parcubacteria group bacterium RIFCSPHIGHO2_01_FULL_45_26]|nr:MAG: hypothetical protein A2749_00845 [Parcubacteria group bacterium RIFCSPHIGHO2_01_FULL_45_26]
MHKAGTVILLPFPFTDMSGSKIRPALVVSGSTPGEDIVVVFISSKHSNIGKYDIVVEPSKQNGLKAPSVIKCAKIATLDKKIILGELGRLDSKILTQVKVRLTKVLELRHD